MQTLIRCHIMWHLIWVCTVCLWPFYGFLGKKGLKGFSVPKQSERFGSIYVSLDNYRWPHQREAKIKWQSCFLWTYSHSTYRTNSMYWDTLVSANSAVQGQTASEEAVWSGSTLFAITSASFGCINAMLHQTFLFLGQLWQLFEVSQILEFLR